MRVVAQPLSRDAFAPFGDVLDSAGAPNRIINAGLCARYHDRARMDFGPGGRAGISLFDAEPRSLPYQLDLVERHPEGSQAFIPMHRNDWLVTVADPGEIPGAVHAFIAGPGQGINLHRGTWHGVLAPLHAPGLFAVVDRIGDTENLQEYRLDAPIMIAASCLGFAEDNHATREGW